MSESPKPTTSRRRWLRFSLRSSLIAVTVIAVLMATIGNLLVTMDGVEDFLRRKPDRTVCFNRQILETEDVQPEE